MFTNKTKLKAAAILAAALFVAPAYSAAGSVDLNGDNITPLQGKVTVIAPYYATNGDIVESTFFMFMDLGGAEDGGENIVSFLVTEETELVNELKIAAGAEVKAYYDKNLPVVMIYPPRYNAVAVEVLTEAAETAEPEENEKQAPDTPGKIPENSIFVNGVLLDAPQVYDENHFTMVPLRAVCEKLGSNVTWNAEEKRVEIGFLVSLTIGEDAYNFARRAPIKLGAAPVVRDGTTFVPLEFFGDVLGYTYGYLSDGDRRAVIIENKDTDIKLAE